MLFISSLEIIPGKTKELTDKATNPKMIQGVIIKEILGVFGKPDIILIFELHKKQNEGDLNENKYLFC